MSFGAGIGPEDVEVRNAGLNAVVALVDGSGSMTFVNGNAGSVYYQPDEIRFADGTVWKRSSTPRK